VSDLANSQTLTPQPGGRSLLELLRIKDWHLQNGLFLLGAAYSGSLASLSWPLLATGLVVSSLCLAHGYALNQFYDELSQKLEDHPRLARRLLGFTYLLLVLALGLSCLVSRATTAVVALIGLTSWLHSSPPCSLKRHIFWRLFLNSFGFALVFLAGASLDNRLPLADLLMGILIFLLYVPLELIHVLAHMESDRKKGIPTLPLVRGEKNAVAWALATLAALILYGGLLWLLGFASLAFAGWSLCHLSLLMLSLLAFRRRHNTIQTYERLRWRAKIVCAVYGLGLLAIFTAQI
jgi:4-hydroxybenzoate polyprenyltransferase